MLKYIPTAECFSWIFMKFQKKQNILEWAP